MTKCMHLSTELIKTWVLLSTLKHYTCVFNKNIKNYVKHSQVSSYNLLSVFE